MRHHTAVVRALVLVLLVNTSAFTRGLPLVTPACVGKPLKNMQLALLPLDDHGIQALYR